MLRWFTPWVGDNGPVSERTRTRFNRTQRRFFITSLLDSLTPKSTRSITFVCKRRFGFSGNIRAACLALARTKRYDVRLWCEAELPERTRSVLREEGVTILSRFSVANVIRLVSSGTIVVDHSIGDAYISRKSRFRTVVNLWHGVPVKNIELGMQHLTEPRRLAIRQTSRLYDLMIASSERDGDAIATSFGIPRDRVQVTGLPRYDLLFGDAQLDRDLVEDETAILRRLGGRRLVLYAPTFREAGPSPLEMLTTADWKRLGSTVAAHNAVLGVRKHPYDPAPCPTELDGVLELAPQEFPETNLLLRHAQMLITDFSSIWVDYVLLSRPIAGFAKDRDHYGQKERGFIYALDEVFPGPFHSDVEALTKWLHAQLSAPAAAVDHAYQRSLFHAALKPPYTGYCVDVISNCVERTGAHPTNNPPAHPEGFGA